MKDPNPIETDFMRALHLGYDSSDPAAFAVKVNWKRVSKAYFQKVLRDLSITTANVWFSAGGPGVSGDIHMQAMLNGCGIHLFGNIDHILPWFTIRPITRLGDYTGGLNTTIKLEDMSYPVLTRILTACLKGNLP